MFKNKKDVIFYLAFFAFLLFINTPYGLGTRTTLTRGVTAVKTYLFPPEAEEDRTALDATDVSLKGIFHASNINLKELEGKVVFINHWASWCPPCRAEMPSLKKLYDTYKDRVVFIYLTTDSRTEVQEYYAEKSFNFPTYQAQSNLPSQISSNSLPATFILDKNSRVVLKEFGAADWNSKQVHALLDNLILE